MILLTFIILCYGICNIIIYSSLFTGFREFLKKFGTGNYSLHKLFTCFICLGTWIGFLTSFIFISFNKLDLLPLGFLNNIYLTVILHGFLASGGVWLTETIQDSIDSIKNYFDRH